jgi:uncharacterized protein (DUF2267 family)
MSGTRLELFEKTLIETYEWIDEIVKTLEWNDRHYGLQALRGTLHALRDELSVDQSAKLAAQLPTLIRGMYYESWNPPNEPLRSHKNEFLTRVERALGGYVPKYDTELVAQTVLHVLEHRTSGECSKIKASLPKDLRALWPVEAHMT